MKNENNTLRRNHVKKYIALAVAAVFILGMFCACGGSGEEAATDATEASKSTVTAGEAAEKAAQDKADKEAQEPTTRKKTGTEDPAIDSVKAAAYEDIKGFDGKWKNIEVDVDDTITTIDFDWNDNHYQYQFDQATGQIIR